MDEPGWELLSKRDIHRGYVTLTEHEVMLPNGDVTQYEVEESVPCGVAVLGLTEDGMLRLAREYRYPVGTWIYDLPGGGANIGEDPAESTKKRQACARSISSISTRSIRTRVAPPLRFISTFADPLPGAHPTGTIRKR